MIISLKGTISDVLPTGIVLVVNNIGYQVFCTQHALAKWQPNDEVTVITYHHIREDAQVLYGFESMTERQLFETLISVSGIGPKVAMGILSNIKQSDFVQAIQTDNVMLITQIPGIGKKTAERMIIELKDKIRDIIPSSDQPIINASPAVQQTAQHDSEDIVLALRQLGYQKEEIKRAFMKHATELAAKDNIEDQIKILLKYL